ncbi:MAG: twin-arginine translocase subunit TatC [Parachlamydia sp.]|nr:twin-arginine translocase subunit TatC [Parachlamydia sp.]
MQAALSEHLTELRRTLILSLLALAIGIALCFCFYQNIFSWITRPLHHIEGLQRQEIRRERLFNSSPHEVTYAASSESAIHPSPSVRLIQEKVYAIPPGAFLEIEKIQNSGLVLFGPAEGMLTAFKVCFWLGLLLSSPLWATLILRFVLPALHPTEKRLLFLFLTGSTAALIAGFCVAYFLTIPLANRYLEVFNSSIGSNLWSLSHYLDYTLMLMIANGLIFEIGLGLFLLVHAGILTEEWMRSKRRYMIVLAFILGALLTPPDVPTQLMVAIPLLVLYELAIFYAKTKITP